MPATDQAFDGQVRAAVYDAIITGGAIPTLAATAAALGSPAETVADAFRRLAAGHVLVLQPERDEILMANPFSAVPTAFAVEAGGHNYWGNCVWDALGILAMLGGDGRVLTSCGDCGAALALEVRGGALVGEASMAHFAIPAKQWWDDIAFT
ncbi:MAG TPA: organomercurial lyase [Ktedonobacterales bacterium]|nr:organomercurial lyase [Ktedonobacterales bacterium]